MWQRVFEALAEDPDQEYAMIDSTIVRAHFSQCETKKGMQTQKRLDVALVGLSTNIHAVVDALANPIGFHLT
ncbi:hypothetical protein [Microcoleus sp. BROC3]|uniref:hypothetical protein n=1 Tax=Microcoleus sp. BROC3 TaxID=3055323 RepID=UPI00404072E8